MAILANMSIQRKQTLIIMATSAVVLLLACAALSVYEVITFRKAMVQNLSTLANIVGDNTAVALDFNDAKSAQDTLSALQTEPSIIGACLYTKAGSVFAKYDRTNDVISFTPPTVPPAGAAFQGQRLTLSRPVVYKGETIGAVYLESDLQALYSRLTRYAGIVGLVFAASLLIAFALSSQLQRLVSGPIMHLAQVARSVTLEKNYSLRASKQSNDELGQLVDGFNEMLAQIQERDAALQAARDSLERRVQERTVELGTANQSLLEEIGERKRAEESLRLLGSAVEQADESILITDTQLDLPGPIVLFVNPAFTKMTGYTAQEILGKTPRILQGPRTDKAVLARLRETLARGESFHGEAVNYRKDGSEFHFEMHIAPIRDPSGLVTHFVGIKRDITERKRAAEELQWKTAFLEAQVNSSLDGIMVVDEQGRKILQNQRTADLLKIPQHIADDKDDEKQLRWVADMAKHPGQFIEKVVYLNAHPNEISRDEIELKDGTVLDRYSSPVVGKDGKYYGRIWTFRDITERRRFEASLFQSQRMETVGKLAGGIAHEFNSIMTAIIGQCELMLYDLPEGNPLRKNAAEIHQAADRAAALTRQLLAYGRKQILRPDVLDLNTVVAGMENTLRHLAGHDVDVHIAPPSGPKLVKADPGQIEQVIVNIVMNAADAMPHGGKLTLETGERFLDQEYVSQFSDVKPGEYVMLAITDTGAGMSEAVKARIFDPFFTTKDVGKGTGLGLATCHGIIKQSDGHISVYSEPGRGATFKIYLPKVQLEKKSPGPPLQSPGLPRGTETILLVEDDPALREMAATLLGRLGYTVLTAGNGLEALNVTHQRATGHIDLLFTDVVMPHMSGKELSDRIQALYPRTKILFTSAYTENAIVHQGVLNPGITLLQKPFTPFALANKVREVLDRDNPGAAL